MKTKKTTKKSKKDEVIVLFEAPNIEPPEFRLYYDKETGNVLFYTCEKLEGDYIVVDNITFACARHDIRIVDGAIAAPKAIGSVVKLEPDSEGITCAEQDVSIISKNNDIKVKKWNTKSRELK